MEEYAIDIAKFKLRDKYRQTLNQLDALARARCRQTYRNLGGKDSDFAEIEEKLKDPYFSPESILLETMHKLSKQGTARYIHQFNGFVREYQALTNHAVHLTSGDFVSRFLFHILESKEFKSWRQPRNLEKFLTLCLEAHQAVETFCEARAKESARYFEEIEARVFSITGKRNPISDELTPKFEKQYENIRSASHHALDWYLLESPHIAHQKRPNQLAALAVGIVQRVSSIAEQSASPITLRELAEFGGWKGGASSFSGALMSPFYDVIYAAGDIPLLFYFDAEEPDGWLGRLAEVAPALKNRPVPSPFF